MLNVTKESTAYHLYKSGREQDIIPTSLEDYVFKFQRVMPFRDIIYRAAQDNLYLLPGDNSFSELHDAWKLYMFLKGGK